MGTNTRSRMMAIAAAAVISLGAGTIGVTQALTDSGDSPVAAFFPIEPCRLASNATITADNSITLDGWGDTGDCALPDDITGLAANVTAVGATQQTNLRFYAEGDDAPGTANLNPTPGAPPTPNAVNVSLNAVNGKFRVYNRFGTVGVFIDVMGYYDDHTHDERYYTKEEVDAIVAADGNPAGIGETTITDQIVELEHDSWSTVATVKIVAPAPGVVLVNSAAVLEHGGPPGSDVACLIQRSTDPTISIDTIDPGLQWFEKASAEAARGSVSGTAKFEVATGTAVFELRCAEHPVAGSGRVESSTLNAVYVPTN